MYENSRFNEVLKALPRDKVEKIIKKHDGDRYRKKFSSWQHLVTMILSQLSDCRSLRDIESLLNSQQNSFYHLGIKNEIKRSTLSDANSNRSMEIFKDLSILMLSRLKGEKKELSELVTALDSSIIRAPTRGSSWAVGSRSSTKGLKLHVQYDNSNDHIEYSEVTCGNINDITVAQDLPLENGRIYVFDKGYMDYNWWNKIMDTGSKFVTRLKKNSAYRVLEHKEIKPSEAGYVLKDQIIELVNRNPRGGKKNELASKSLRMLSIRHPDALRKDPLVIVSNDLESSSSVVAGWYKDRWSVELVFKWLKQNLKLKNFIGESRNAMMIQIYTAIITYVLLKLYKAASGLSKLRLKDVSTILKSCLFERPNVKKIRERERRIKEDWQPSLFSINYFARAS